MSPLETIAPKTAARLAAMPEHKRRSKSNRTIGGLVIIALTIAGARLGWNQYLLASLGVLAGSVWAGEYILVPFNVITEAAVRLFGAARGSSNAPAPLAPPDEGEPEYVDGEGGAR